MDIVYLLTAAFSILKIVITSVSASSLISASLVVNAALNIFAVLLTNVNSTFLTLKIDVLL